MDIEKVSDISYVVLLFKNIINYLIEDQTNKSILKLESELHKEILNIDKTISSKQISKGKIYIIIHYAYLAILLLLKK